MAAKQKTSVYREYWAAYGGWKAQFRSRYFWSAVVITALQYTTWTQPGWWDLAIQVLPNLIGFSLGGYAIMLSFGDEKFRAFLLRAGKKDNPVYLSVSATFAHFVLVQFASLIVALVMRAAAASAPLFSQDYLASDSKTGGIIAAVMWFMGYFLFMYSMTSGIAATLAVFRCSRWFHQYNSLPAEPDEKQSFHLQGTIITPSGPTGKKEHVVDLRASSDS